ncbi:MAG: hypothetical protein ACI4Q3_09445 [Kiritimatiellia bacterium]
MRRRLLLVSVALAALALPAGPLAARIAEIEAWLPEKPGADGARIADRAAWGRLAATPNGTNEIKAAEALLDQPVPDVPDAEYLEFTRNGNRTRYQRSLGRRLAAFNRLFVAECLEDRGRFIPKIVAYADAFCAMKSWTLPAHDSALTCFNGKPHVDLMAGCISLALAFCHDWLGERLPAATRAKMYAELDRRTFQPYLRHARGQEKIPGHWWFHCGNNWNSVCNACVVRTALAVVEDRRLRAEFVAFAEGSVPFALAGYTDDGYCSEGMGYWNYGYGHHLEMGLAVRAATGGKVDFFADPKCRAVMEYAYGFQLQSGLSPHFADGGGNASPAYLALGRQIWSDLANTAALRAEPFHGGPALFSLRAFGQEPAPVAPALDELPARSWFSDAQVLISRVHHADRTMRMALAVKGGHNAELHNHNDVGTYCIMLDGTEMAGDPGGEIYTRRTFSKDRYVSKVLNSYGHPVPVVGGSLQQTGRAAAAKVVSRVFTDGTDTLVLDCTAAYDVKALKSLVRTVVFDRAGDRIEISDRAVFTEPTAFEVPVVTYREFTRNAEATEFLISKSPTTSRKLKLAIAATAPVSFREESIENPGLPSVRRLAFSFAKPVLEGTFTTTYSSR